MAQRVAPQLKIEGSIKYVVFIIVVSLSDVFLQESGKKVSLDVISSAVHYWCLLPGYWQAIFTGRVFFGRSMQDCLQVIHSDIIGVWNFRDDDKVRFAHSHPSFYVFWYTFTDSCFWAKSFENSWWTWLTYSTVPWITLPHPHGAKRCLLYRRSECFHVLSYCMLKKGDCRGVPLVKPVKWVHNIYQQTYVYLL